METSTLFPLKYRLRKTDEPVEIVAWETAEKGSRSENDWVSYIDSDGNEHIKEHLTLEWDFVTQDPFGGGIMSSLSDYIAKMDNWEPRRYELVKEYVLRDLAKDKVNADKAVAFADDVISALKKSPEAEEPEDKYENIGVGEIVDAFSEEGIKHAKKFVFTDRKDIVGYRGDGGRWDVGDRVKVYIKRFKPQEEERPVP